MSEIDFSFKLKIDFVCVKWVIYIYINFIYDKGIINENNEGYVIDVVGVN